VAILYSLDSLNGLNFMPFDRDVNYMTVLNQMYQALYRLNVGTDFIFPESRNLADYNLILVPPLYVASDELLGRLSDYVKNGGHVLMAFKSGFADENSTVRWVRSPGPLRQVCGFSYQEFTNLRNPLRLKGDPFGAAEGNTVSSWAEYLEPESAEALAYYDHPVLGKYPAVTRNRCGKGTLIYEGTHVSDSLQEKIIINALKTAAVPMEMSGLPAEVRVKHAVLADGTPVHAFFNFSGKTQQFVYGSAGVLEVLSGRPIKKSQAVTLPPWDLAIIKE
jgi:beta-galactosidase